MKIKELTEARINQELLVSEARELIVELSTEVLKLIKAAASDKSLRPDVDSRIAFLDILVSRAVIKYTNTNNPAAEFIRTDGAQLLQHVKTMRQTL